MSLSAAPYFHNVLIKSPNMANYLYEDQIQPESKVSDGVIYSRTHPGGRADNGFGEVLQDLLKRYDYRFSQGPQNSQGLDAYWTFQIRLARVNSGSKWHSYAKSLPSGIQTIKRRIPTKWFAERVVGWLDVAEMKVIVY